VVFLPGNFLYFHIVFYGRPRAKFLYEEIWPSKTQPETRFVSEDMLALEGDDDPDCCCGEADSGCRIMPQCSFRSVDHFFYIHTEYRLYSCMSEGDGLYEHKRDANRDK
jgi:hypothetical protein